MGIDLLITTDRLILRPIKPEDAEFIFEYRSDSVENQYQGWIPESISDVHDFITNKVVSEINQPGTWYQLVLIDRDTEKLIGDIGIYFSDSDPLITEIGYTLCKDYQGRGMASEALKETISYLFAKLNKRLIVASIDHRNKKSIRLVERLGFKLCPRETGTFSEKWPNDLVYRLRKAEWKKN